MEKDNILEYLKNNQVEHANVLEHFIKTNNELYARSNQFGHITGSAFIVNAAQDEALLILHKKYNKWVAPGGHVDAGENALAASMRETGEEVGLSDLLLLSPKIFDIDIHRIPAATKNGIHEPEHWHFDVRYLYQAAENSVVNLNILEAKGFQWSKLEKLALVDDRSIKRQAEKALNFDLESEVKQKPRGIKPF